MREDFYFAYERSDSENYIWQQLPSNFCRILGVDAYECITFEFDFSYFDKQNVDIDNYAPEFKTMYNIYKKSGKRWQKLDSEKAICFKFDKSVLYTMPFFSAMFEEILGLDDYKDIQDNSTKSRNYKLLTQKIPMNTDKDAKINSFLIDDKAAIKFHNNVRANVPEFIGVVTTPMEITSITLDKQQTEEDIVGKAERNLFTTAGVSELLFNSDKGGSVGLNRSIEENASIMFGLLRQYEVWFKKRLKIFNNNSRTYKWKLIFPDITIYNRADMFDKLLKSAQFGYSKFYVSASLGLSQSEILDINTLENTLNLIDNLKPLQSSHTQANDIGRPLKDENNLSDKGAEQRDKEANDNRAK